MRRDQTPPWKRRKAKVRKPAATRIDGTPVKVMISSVGHQGDGIAMIDPDQFNGATQAFIPNTLPEDEVMITPKAQTKSGIDAELVEIITPSRHRRGAECDVAAECGGCRVHMMSDALYQNWKLEMVQTAVKALNIADTAWLEPFTVGNSGRRRARLAYRRLADGIICGFRARKSHHIIAPLKCVILKDSLMRCTQTLTDDILPALAQGSQGEVVITDTDQGWDIVLYPEKTPSHDEITGMINAASASDTARFSIAERDTITPHLTKRVPTLTWSNADGKGFSLYPAPGSFLQADADAEALMQRDIINGLEGCRSLLDLFCGSGSLSLPLLMQEDPPKLIHGYDSGEDGLDAMLMSAKAAEQFHRVKVTKQNLFKDPLTTAEINSFDTVIVDPPRAGAATLMPALADSDIKRVMMISCNPQSFAKDAAILIEGGYHCTAIRMIDQFLRTPHAELVARFERAG